MNHNFTIKPTKTTPEIQFDSTTGELYVKGISFPENAKSFYTPAFQWLENYITNTPIKTILTFDLYALNTSSSKCIYTILRYLNDICKKGHNVFVKWCYEDFDEDMLELGQDYELLLSIPFEFIPVKK